MAWQPGDDPRYEPAVRELTDWTNVLTLQRAHGSQLHSLIDDWKQGRLIRPRPAAEDLDFDAHTAKLLSPKYQIFVVEHDWSSAFDNAPDFKADINEPYDFQIPYPDCCFEFVLSAKRVCFLSHFDGENYRIAAFVRLKEGWLQPPLKWPVFRPLAFVLNLQFRAIGIALEAQVAVSEVIRAPHKLNRAKERRGRQPVNDYHIIKLPSRARPSRADSDPSDERRGVRLHFRRGHWRHFENHRTWIKWTLVGDPDLGFIEKHYRL